MTGFGSATRKENELAVSVELKSVNNRYFKLALRMSDGYPALESKVEPLLRNVIERGTISAAVKIHRDRQASDYKISAPVLQTYFEQLLDVAAKYSEHIPRLDQLLLLPGVVETASETSEDENEIVWQLVEKTIQDAINGMQTMRRAEGESMSKDLAANLETLAGLVGKVEQLAPRVAPLYRQRLKERIGAVMSEQNLVLNNGDLLREVALFADRCDISEETVRFRSHLEQFNEFLKAEKSCGRKLDFLTQELFRETNTMGSKANDAEITKQVVEMKNIIERIREMVQNVE